MKVDQLILAVCVIFTIIPVPISAALPLLGKSPTPTHPRANHIKKISMRLKMKLVKLRIKINNPSSIFASQISPPLPSSFGALCASGHGKDR